MSSLVRTVFCICCYRWSLCLAVFLGVVLTACSLRPIVQESYTFTATPAQIANILEMGHNNFGICYPFILDRRGTRLGLWDEFQRQRSTGRPLYRVEALTGYEIGVTRGETCHIRMFSQFQTAVSFDLSSLPPGSVIVQAELRIYQEFYPEGISVERGTSEQCAVIRVGQATEDWSPGQFGIGSEMGNRPMIAFRPARPHVEPLVANRYTGWLSVDVTHTVSEWMRGARPNYGFTLTPDLGRVRHYYNAAEDTGFSCELGIARMELVVLAGVPR